MVSIAEAFIAYYEEFYASLTRMTEDYVDLLREIRLRGLSREERDKSDAELSEEEVTTALQGLQSGKGEWN
ncbi:hypothetical protein NDU88_002938 [Pleurodeles waltl]|uniref:Uncharacterized protein n=1 Tax=Pleurodeles waltl TaxID=8319 RepID=A0AAV7Q857_PLEWA|nr:hypothetical protein NDU88_002938 [Pleurodeles waltl]